MGELIKKINWKKVMAIASRVVSGVIAFNEARSDQQSTARLEALETRVNNLESK